MTSKTQKLQQLCEAHDTGAITAYRRNLDIRFAGESFTSNQKRNVMLRSTLLVKGYSILSMVGPWLVDDEVKTDIESYLVIDRKDSGRLKTDLLDMGRRFDQTTVLFAERMAAWSQLTVAGGDGRSVWGTALSMGRASYEVGRLSFPDDILERSLTLRPGCMLLDKRSFQSAGLPGLSMRWGKSSSASPDMAAIRAIR